MSSKPVAMFCGKCGESIPDSEATFCPQCGSSTESADRVVAERRTVMYRGTDAIGGQLYLTKNGFRYICSRPRDQTLGMNMNLNYPYADIKEIEKHNLLFGLIKNQILITFKDDIVIRFGVKDRDEFVDTFNRLKSEAAAKAAE